MYTDLRTEMRKSFCISNFGPESIPRRGEDESNTNYKKRIEKLDKLKKEGYTRVKNKIRELRRGYKQAVDRGTRSGSGRLVADNYDLLREIWGGCPSVTAIPTGRVSLQTMEQDVGNVSEEEEEQVETVPEESVPEDKGKRVNMQKKLSAHQRDMMLVDLAREELELKRENTELTRRSLQQTEEAIKGMTESMNLIGNGIKDVLGLLANAFLKAQTQTQPPMYPFYNNFLWVV